jgi:DNA-binding CsgD family transcriptional regulator
MARAHATNARQALNSVSIERERELEAIGAGLDAAVAGEGRVLVIEGPSGIGKSRLLETAKALAGERGMDVLRARGDELERSYAFGVVLRLFEAKLSPEPAEAGLLRGRAALAAPLLVRDQNKAPARTTDEFALLHGLYWCIVNLSEQHPVALLVDDVHWADDFSLRFLNYLAQRLEDLPVALIIAITTGDPLANSGLVARLASVAEETIQPAQLSAGGVRSLFEAAELPVTIEPELIDASWEATGGNPFLLTELIGAIRSDPEEWTAASPASVAAFAPHSVRHGLTLRLSRFGTEAVALAQSCSVLGDSASLRVAAELVGLEIGTAGEAAEILESGGIFATTDPISFAHPMIRSAVYGALPPGERARTHVRAASLLHDAGAAPDEIATHLLAGTPSPEAWAGEALHEGARAAARKGAPQVAVRYLRRALDQAPLADRTAGMLVDLGIFEAAAGETISLQRFEDALAMITEPREQAHALYALGRTLYRYGRHRQAAETFLLGAERFESKDRGLAIKFQGAYTCASQFVASLHVGAMRRLEEIADADRETGEVGTEDPVLLANLSVHWAGTRAPAERAANLAVEALGDGELVRVETSESMAVNIAIAGLIFCGRLPEAQRAVEVVLADARTRGAALAFAEASMMRAMVMHARGQVADAMADAQMAIDGMARGWQGLIPLPQAILAHCLIERGELEAAQEVLTEVEPILPGAETSYLNAWFHCARGRLRLIRSQAKEALDDLLQVERDLEPYARISPAFAPWRSLAGLALHSLGEDSRGLALIEEEVDLATRFDLPISVGAAMRLRARLEQPPQRLATLERSVELLETVEGPLELARSLHDLGRNHRHAGRRVMSREPLLRALDLAHRCGATALEASARQELNATGARPRRPAMSGVESLTPSERRIADLAAAGNANRAIAEMLFLTKNTVDWHLRNVYRKLEINSRDALAETLKEDPEERARE